MVHIPPLERLHLRESRRARITRLAVTILLGVVAFGGLALLIASVVLKRHAAGGMAATAAITLFALVAL
jgi:hypothetical protein